MNAQNRKNKSIRMKTFLSLNVLFLFLAIGIYLILNTVMMDKVAFSENKYVIEHVKRAENSLGNEMKRLSQIVGDWAPWDDTYEFIKNNNAEYVVNNLSKAAISNLSINEVVFINESGKYIYAGSMNETKGEIEPASNGFLDYIGKSPISKNIDPNYRLSGIIMLPEGPMLIAAHPILTSNGEGPVRGNLVFGVYLNEVKVSYLAKDLNLKMKIEPLDQLKPSDTDDMEAPAFVHALSNDKIKGCSILRDIYGEPVLRLSIEMDREFSSIGRNGIKTVLILLITASLIFTLFLMVLIEKNIISRLMTLSKEVRIIGKGRMFSKRLSPQKVQDELTLVSDEINNMLNELEKSQSQLNESQKALKEINQELEEKVQQRTIDLSRANEKLKSEIVEREKIQNKIKYLAYHDSLTNLPNRLLFNDQLNHAVQLAERSREMLAVMFLDLDSFKTINNTMGHVFGDQLLIEVSGRLKQTLRKSDIIARIGGDEFVILLENMKDLDAVMLAANEILKSFIEPLRLNSQDHFITTSIGIALYPSDGNSAEVLIKNADIAMYKAKEKGKNQCVFFSAAMKTAIVENVKLSNQLYRAIERNELELYYQPQISSYTEQIVGMEALLRWKHPELGMISPCEFIPIAEQTGLIIPIGQWVIRTACKQNKLWQAAGYPKIRMGVNLSIKQFQDPNLVTQVRNIIKDTEIEPQYLQFEVTESIAMKEKGYIVDTLDIFKAMGINIALDDFGTEYSSLSILKHLPIDTLKVAMPFIQSIGTSEKDEAITKTIILLAKSMGLVVIAEGVETENQLAFLRDKMCDEIQGYYYSKPLSAAEFEELLKKSVKAVL